MSSDSGIQIPISLNKTKAEFHLKLQERKYTGVTSSYTQLRDFAWSTWMLSQESLSDTHHKTTSDTPSRPLSILLAVSAKIIIWDTHNQSAQINHPFLLCFDFLFTQLHDSTRHSFACLQLAGWSFPIANAV